MVTTAGNNGGDGDEMSTMPIITPTRAYDNYHYDCLYYHYHYHYRCLYCHRHWHLSVHIYINIYTPNKRKEKIIVTQAMEHKTNKRIHTRMNEIKWNM